MLGDDFVLLLVVAVVSGVIAGFFEAGRFHEKTPSDTDELNPLLVRAGLCGALLVFAYVDSKDIAISIGHAAVIIGVYKIFKIFTSVVAFWRLSNSPTLVSQNVEANDG